jgi:hypothetical protein
MANRKATFAKRQRETDLKDRAKQKEDRRSQKRTEVRENKGPQIAWDEAVHAVTSSDDLPPLGAANQGRDDDADTTADVTDVANGAQAVNVERPAPRPASPASPEGHSSSATGSAAPGKPASSAASGPVAKPASVPSPAAPRRVG